MKRIISKDFDVSKMAYFSDDLCQRYLLEVSFSHEITTNIAVILMNPKNNILTEKDDILKKVEGFLQQKEYPAVPKINFTNLFPFVKNRIKELNTQLAANDLHQMAEFKKNLAMMKSVIKSADKIILAWGSLPDELSKQKFQTAIADVYHLLRMFNKTENCYVFSIKEKNALLDEEGNPFHPNQGTLESLQPIENLWMENMKIQYRFTKMSHI
ncbi:MAG: DUF1643 domain-containing protein [Kurthia sp.]|nr:DUF1643 domain-containing protein [Candidatus Kurthia equi]